MRPYNDFVVKIENLCTGIISGVIDRDDPLVVSALNGEAARMLNKTVSYRERYKSGAFFTGSALAAKALSGLAGLESLKSAKFYDPACGAGDLLVELAKQTPISEDFDITLADWEKRFFGTDIHPEFVRATKARLLLLALHRSSIVGSLSCIENDIFKNIKLCCGLKKRRTRDQYDCIVMNPPFNRMLASNTSNWARGKVNAASIFFHNYVFNSPTGTEIIAILPEVLRSGSRYEAWRDLIDTRFSMKTLKTIGQFSNNVDVDVFVVQGTVASSGNKANWYPRQNADLYLRDHFNISIGPVVDYRDPKCGPNVPYLKARNLAKWVEISDVSERRRFSGRLIESPFVVVRRTSRPGDKYRAIATLVNIKVPVAVDNHLIVLSPKCKSLDKCFDLIEMLKDENINLFLDRRIRCRHLTVSAVGEIPWMK